MTISTLAELKENECYMALNYTQSQYDAVDVLFARSQFTRSPWQAISFLMTYAGLDGEQRVQVVSQLKIPAITTLDLDGLVRDIDWISMLNIPKSTTLQLNLRISLANKAAFFEAIQERCPGLYEAINTITDILIIEERADKVTFTFNVSQEGLWSERFYRSHIKEPWLVPSFNLSPALVNIIENLSDDHNITFGCFEISKGVGYEARNIQLQITPPQRTNELSIVNELQINPGIYGAFLGLENFYGLKQVRTITVNLDSRATFSDVGATATQKQTQDYSYIGIRPVKPPRPTVIRVDGIIAYFEAMGVVVNFNKSVKKTDSFHPEIYIDLPTRSKEGKVILFAMAPSSSAAFKLVHPSAVLPAAPTRMRDRLFDASIKEALIVEENDTFRKGCCSIL